MSIGKKLREEIYVGFICLLFNVGFFWCDVLLSCVVLCDVKLECNVE